MSLTATVFLISAALAAVLLLKGWSGKPPSEANADASVIEQLRKAGSNLTKPHEIEFFLYFPAEAGARQVAQKLNSMGFKTDVKPAASGSLPWLTFATKSMVPHVDELVRQRKVLSELSNAEGGEYDGWGTPIVK